MTSEENTDATKIAGAAALAATPAAAAAGAIADAPDAHAEDVTILHEESAAAPEVEEATVSEPSDHAGEAVAEDITAQEIIDLSNQVRAEHGLNPLEANAELSEEADQWAKTMSTTGVFEHAEGDFAENIHFYGAQTSAQDVVQDWLNSEGHRENLLNPEATQIGAGVSHDDNGTYSVQRFI
ncbi:CAP domain-containing protein [Corynebacterium lowii]|uniref:Cysteine-rich secretory protein family protein n=1 Tax=Corynebacterium lowii TaxID=1544413 RepID=A0A0Q1DX03_9CORY|nr:CAP domain-containing protein [Corynebacterium lowii]KQB84751.1 Cysteine-rich secretory protein family protein [Corynebacterium lowii]MDP9851655.1 uncharacterized protein YkwD [Corynebacterium lowii]